MKITHAIMTAALSVGLTFGAVSASIAQQGPSNNFSAYQAKSKPKQKRTNLPPGVKCQPGFYNVADCNVSRNGRTFGPEGYEYATETGQHIGR